MQSFNSTVCLKWKALCYPCKSNSRTHCNLYLPQKCLKKLDPFIIKSPFLENLFVCACRKLSEGREIYPPQYRGLIYFNETNCYFCGMQSKIWQKYRIASIQRLYFQNLLYFTSDVEPALVLDENGCPYMDKKILPVRIQTMTVALQNMKNSILTVALQFEKFNLDSWYLLHFKQQKDKE